MVNGGEKKRLVPSLQLLIALTEYSRYREWENDRVCAPDAEPNNPQPHSDRATTCLTDSVMARDRNRASLGGGTTAGKCQWFKILK